MIDDEILMVFDDWLSILGNVNQSERIHMVLSKLDYAPKKWFVSLSSYFPYPYGHFKWYSHCTPRATLWQWRIADAVVEDHPNGIGPRERPGVYMMCLNIYIYICIYMYIYIYTVICILLNTYTTWWMSLSVHLAANNCTAVGGSVRLFGPPQKRFVL